jgi:hypothetical protein
MDRNLRIQTDTGSKTHSRLIIDNAQVSDSGNYTCEISNADPASTLVHISQGQVTGHALPQQTLFLNIDTNFLLFFLSCRGQNGCDPEEEECSLPFGGPRPRPPPTPSNSPPPISPQLKL